MEGHDCLCFNHLEMLCPLLFVTLVAIGAHHCYFTKSANSSLASVKLGSLVNVSQYYTQYRDHFNPNPEMVYSNLEFLNPNLVL